MGFFPFFPCSLKKFRWRRNLNEWKNQCWNENSYVVVMLPLKADPTFTRQKHSKEWTQSYGISWEGVRTGRNCFLVCNALVIGVSSPRNIVHFCVIPYTRLKWMKHFQQADFPNQQFLMHTQQRCQQIHTDAKTAKDQAPGFSCWLRLIHVVHGGSQQISACCGFVFPSINRNL